MTSSSRERMLLEGFWEVHGLPEHYSDDDDGRLRGDASGGLPGVAGIGEKTASSLMWWFGGGAFGCAVGLCRGVDTRCPVGGIVRQPRSDPVGGATAGGSEGARHGAHLLRRSGLTRASPRAIDSDAFGPLTAELRRAEANHHDPETLVPRLVQARGFDDADDIAAAVHHRVAAATARPAGSNRHQASPRLIAGLVPEGAGPMAEEMHRALTERQELIEARATALLDQALHNEEDWLRALGTPPQETRAAAIWRQLALTVVANRDRYGITGPTPLGTPAENDAQKIDAARARTAINRAGRLTQLTEALPQEHVGRMPVEKSF
ncbi:MULTISPECIES: hypothetical protein [Arthrobacter]|uniref:hypothetical protein n=1 Tax=Arthrobacter TaxID=1663 RepID=UPI0027DEE8D9|nr:MULTISPECIES: hypothetical protein [Arthrobacter]